MHAFLQQFTASPAYTLRTLQPTSSTVSYNVSTRPSRKTLLADLSHFVGILFRIIVGLATVSLLYTKWRIAFEKPTAVLLWVIGSERTDVLLGFAEACQWRFLAPSAVALLFLVFRRNYTGLFQSANPYQPYLAYTYTEESLTVLRGLGIQTSTTSSTYLQTPTTRFIPTTSIQDIFIYEAFKGFEVRFYLVIVVEGEEKVVVVFPRMLPKRAILEEVWRGSRKCLWDNDVGRGRGKEKGMVDT
jgi:phosphatidylinositol glycan class H protein